MSNNDISNPLIGVTVGSTVNNLKDGFSASVLEKSITKMVNQTQSRAVMTGQSSSIYSNMMNRGSLGISGSYGVSAISQISGSVSGYVGQSNAGDGRTTKVDYSVILQAGVEYINFNDLNAAMLISSLDGRTQELITEALDAYKALLQPNLKESEKLVALQNWTRAREKFFEAAGNGVVVGVAWGAIGSVSMEMTKSSSSTAWQYGGSGNFTYAGLSNSVSVAATYDGGNASGKGNVDIKVSKYYSGNAIADDVNKWYSSFADKSYADLADVKVVSSPSFPSSKLDPPSIPSFFQPKPNQALKVAIEDLKNLEELDKLTKEAHRADLNKKKVNEGIPEIPEEDYKQLVNKKADIIALNQLKSRVRANSI